MEEEEVDDDDDESEGDDCESFEKVKKVEVIGLALFIMFDILGLDFSFEMESIVLVLVSVFGLLSIRR